MDNPWMLVLLVGALAACTARLLWPRHLLLAVAEGEDADMKILDGPYVSQPSPEDAAETAAKMFLLQKQCGNIDKAREVGSFFASCLLHPERGPLYREREGQPPFVRRQIDLLHSYVVNRVIAEYSPNSILAQTSLNVFYSDIETTSEELYRHVSDMTAFSLYILCERSPTRNDSEIGAVFAGLCGKDGDGEAVNFGNRLFSTFYQDCKGKMQEISYATVELDTI